MLPGDFGQEAMNCPNATGLKTADDCCRRKRVSEIYVEVSGMHLAVTVALVTGFIALLISGFLSVAHD